MFLTTPSVIELQMLELPVLLQMLNQQTADYIQLLKEEGFCTRTTAVKQFLDNIQEAIQAKRVTEQEKTSIVPIEGNVIPGAGISKPN